MNRHLSKEDIQMSTKHMKRYSTSLVIRETQIKTMPSCHFKPSKRNQKDKHRVSGRTRETGALIRGCWTCNMVQLLRTTSGRFSQDRTRLPCDPAILPRHTPKRSENTGPRDSHTEVPGGIIRNKQKVAATQVPKCSRANK